MIPCFKVQIFYYLIGDENVRLVDNSVKEESEEDIEMKPDLRRFIPSYIPERCKTIGMTPAVKLTFSQTITIGQLKAIKVKLQISDLQGAI